MSHIDHEQDRSIVSGVVTLDSNAKIVTEELEWFVPGKSNLTHFQNNIVTTEASAGFYYTFRDGFNTITAYNVPLDNGTIPYDGSDLKLHIYTQLVTTNGGPGDEIDWKIEHQYRGIDDFVHEASVTGLVSTDVSSFNADELNDVEVIIMSGVLDAKILFIEVNRIGTTDAYNDDIDLFGIFLEKV